MYAWIWRKLPLGLPGKLVGTLVLLSAVGALLWYVAFPWAEPLLPFDDVQVGDPGSGYGDVGTVPGDEHDLPYDTDGGTVPSSTPSGSPSVSGSPSPTPSPSPSPKRSG